MCHLCPGKRIDRRWGGFSEVSERYLAVFDPFDTDHSFAGRERDVQWIANEILHRMMCRLSPGKRMDRRCEGFGEVSGRFSAVFDPFDTDGSFAGREWEVQWIAHQILHRMMCIPTLGKRIDRRCKGFSEVSDRFSAVFDPFDADRSFAGRERDVQWIAHQILHQMMWRLSPGKRMDRR